MKIEIKNHLGEIIFSHEKENNTLKITIEAAVKAKINLSGADLSGADLSDADLSDANLSGANLRDANLRDADLSGADLSYAYLIYANLSGANLRDANLRGANLNCIGDMKFIFSMQIDYWNVCFTKDILQIGCQKHSINEWKNFSDVTISQMHLKALEWWKRWKQPLFAIIDERLKDAN